jgi:hypothetical protein
MKNSLKSLLAASILAGFASAAQAATVDVYITGSSAFRGAVTNAIAQLLSSPTGAYEGNAAGGLASANQQIITGVPNSTGTTAGLTSGNTYFFHTCWTGSLGGLATLAYNVKPTLPTLFSGGPVAANPYMKDTQGTGYTFTAITAGDGQGTATGNVVSGGQFVSADETSSTAVPATGFADGAFSDVFQTSTSLQKVSLTPATVASGNSDGVVGVVPFVFVANPDLANLTIAAGGKFSASKPNMTATTAQQLYGGGIFVPQLTGNSSDVNLTAPIEVLATGRDADSGTRFTTFAETGFNPIGGVNKPTQYQVQSGTFSGKTIDVSLYPGKNLFPGTAAEQDFADGQSGYTSGGNERGALAISGTSTSSSDNPSYIIGSLGESDSITIITSATSGPCYMSYNGVNYADKVATSTSAPFDRTLIEQGDYTLWGYEHCYLDPNTNNTAVINAVAAQVRSTNALISGDQIANMAVGRAQEGGPISYTGVGSTGE